MKVMYLDTSVIVKYFCLEDQRDIVRWLLDPETSLLHSLYFATSHLAKTEFKKALLNKVKSKRLTDSEANGIRLRAKPYFDNYFHAAPIDGSSELGLDRDELVAEIVEKTKLTKKKDSQDVLHIATIVNNLRFFDGESRPHLVTADDRFAKAIIKMGYPSINILEYTLEKLRENLHMLSKFKPEAKREYLNIKQES